MAVERLQWTIDAINTRLDKRDHEDDERFEKLTRSFENQITACSNAVSRVAETQEKWQEAEQARRERAKKEDLEVETQTQTSRRAMWGLLGAAALSGVFLVVATLIQALNG